jgi:hypothetical protein
MKNLFEAATVEEVKGRMAQLRPDSERQWGKMNPAQALAHCSAAMEMAIDWAAAGAVGEEVDDREREADAPQFGDGQELGGD